MELLSETEAAEFISTRLGIGCSRWTMLNHRKKGSGPPYYKIGGRCLYRPEDIEAWIDASRIDPQQEACEG